MSKLIKMLTMTLVLATMLLVSVTGAVFAEKAPSGIVVSPNYLNVDSYSSYAHIHTDMFVSNGITGVKVTVNNVDIEDITLGVDTLGYLVVKFEIDQV